MTITESRELAVHASAALAIRPGQEMWTDKQQAALAVLGIKNASNADMAVFMHYCQKTGLDPFSRQIYMICRREKQGDQWVDKQTIQVGIDGFRVIRDRVAGRLGVEVEYEDTVWYDADGREHGVWLSDQPPAACRVVVLKNGRRFPAVLRTSAYAAVNKNGEMVAQWRTQPDHMIEKCAEAFALRRAFPHDLGGVYIEEEMRSEPGQSAEAPRRLTAADMPARPPVPAASNEVAKEEAGPENGSSGAPVRTIMKSQLDKLQKLPLGELPDVEEAVAALIGRPVRRLYELNRDEAERVLGAWDDACKAADRDTEQAAVALLAQAKALQAAQDGGA